MSADINVIVEQMRSHLAVSDPDLDTSAGTTTRKIIDVVAESIAESYLDSHMLNYQYDVDSKTGGDLDTFTQVVGGITRLTGRRATGSITFSVGAPSVKASQMIAIPFGTQVRSRNDDSVVAVTIAGAAIYPGENNVTVPVQVLTPGPEGNVAMGSLTVILSPLDGISFASNLSALSGGANQESDAELRARWKQTAFRSMAGTESMYLAQAHNNINVSAAKIIGSSLTWTEQVQPYYATTGAYSGRLVAQSTNPGCAYAYPTGVTVGGDIANGLTLPFGTAYSFDTSVNPPMVVFSESVNRYATGAGEEMANIEGGVLDLEYRFVPTSSRNDPDGSRFNRGAVMNKVDIVVGGKNPVAVTQSMPFTNKLTFNSNPSSAYYTGNFERVDGVRPAAGNVFIPLQYGPILSVPNTLTIGTSTYGLVGSTSNATFKNAYRLVHDTTPNGRAYNSMFGLEFSAASLPQNGKNMVVGNNASYVYNSVPTDVQSAIEHWRLVGTDVLVHGAITRQIRVSCAIMYQRTFHRADVDTQIEKALSILFDKSGLGQTLQVSDVEQAIHSVAGVDNVRLLTADDHSGWTYATRNNFSTGIQVMTSGAVSKTYINQSGRLQDAIFRDDEMPAFESLKTVVRAQNTFLAS